MVPILLRHCLLQVTNPLSWLQSVSNLPFIQSVLPKFKYENTVENVKAFPRSSHLTSSLISHHPRCQALWSKWQFKLAKHGFPLVNQYWLLLIAYLFFMCLQLGLEVYHDLSKDWHKYDQITAPRVMLLMFKMGLLAFLQLSGTYLSNWFFSLAIALAIFHHQVNLMQPMDLNKRSRKVYYLQKWTYLIIPCSRTGLEEYSQKVPRCEADLTL